MKSLLTIMLGVLILSSASVRALDQDPLKPIAYMTEGPDKITYYSVPFKDPDKFTIVLVSWSKYRAKYSFGWYYDLESGWMKKTFSKDSYVSGINTWVSPHLNRSDGGLVIVNKTLSSPPFKK